LSVTKVLVQVEVIYCGLLVQVSQAKGNLVAGKYEISHQASCVNTLNKAELVAFKEARVTFQRSCSQGFVGVLSLVTV
jgi:hypothetical protein